MIHHSEDQECKEPLVKSNKLNTDDYVYREYLTYTFGSLMTDNNAEFESRVTTETELEDHGIRYGVTWNALAAGITDSSHEVDIAAIPGSSGALIKVLASDGFLTAGDISDQPFTVPAKPPLAVIVSPSAGATFTPGESIELQGYGIDLGNGAVAPGSLNWSSDRDGALGTGSLREVTLSEGTHAITLAIAGSASRATTTVVVQAEPPPAQQSHTYLPILRR